MAVPSPNLFCSGRYGQLSRYLLACGVKPISAALTEILECQRVPTILLTYSPTQREETRFSFDKELAYYNKLISALKECERPLRIVYISSQTVILDDKSLYAQAKLNVERLLSASGLSCLIIRPGFIFSDENRLFLPSLSLLATLPITLGLPDPLFTACRASDLLQRSLKYASSPLLREGECIVEHLGLILMPFCKILDLQRRYSYRLPIPLPLLKALATASPKLRKIIQPVSSTPFPGLAEASSYDG